MEVDASVKRHELKLLMLTSQNSKGDTSLIANELDELGIDHIPVIALRSGKQLRDLMLDHVTNLINNLRAGMRFQSNQIDLAERILEATKKIKNSKVYLMKDNKNDFDGSSLNYQQLISYLKKAIKHLQR